METATTQRALPELPHVDLGQLRERAAAFEPPTIDLSRLDPRRLDLSGIDLSKLDLPADLPGALGAAGRRKRSRRRLVLGAAGLLAGAAIFAAILPRLRAWLQRRDEAAPDTDGTPDPTGTRMPAWAPVISEPEGDSHPSRSPWDPIAPALPDPIDVAMSDSDAPDEAPDRASDRAPDPAEVLS